uniref:Peptidase S1 domain-containing protein n=1 Tax=Anopheles christyi TaxID=43041 RepID=A0A182K9B5_9DIPT
MIGAAGACPLNSEQYCCADLDIRWHTKTTVKRRMEYTQVDSSKPATETCLQTQLGLDSGSVGRASLDTSFGVFIAYRGSRSRCVGSLITPEYVLTAAHCVRKLEAMTLFVNALHVTHDPVLGGFHGDVEPMYVREAILHGEYNFTTRDHDIALLRLNGSVTQEDSASSSRPICIPMGKQHDEMASVGYTLSCFGWGLNARGKPSDSKQWMTLERISLELCQARMDLLRVILTERVIVSERNICTITITGHDAFAGYSGGPLMYRKAGTWYLIGLINYGVGATIVGELCTGVASKMVRTGTRLALVVLLLVNFALGQRQVNQPCILANGASGRCVRIGECSKIAELTSRDVLYLWETQQIRAVLRACDSDENSSDPIVCCEVSQSTPARRRFHTPIPVVSTTTSTTTTSAPTRRTTRLLVTRQRSTTPRSWTPTTVRTSSTSSTTIRYDHFKDVLPARCGEMTPMSLVNSDVEDEGNLHVWVVYLEIQRRRGKARCVGTLIQERYVLTAAHCVQRLKVENIKLYFGLFLISTLAQCLADGECQERRAAEFIVHQEYNSHGSMNDIALIRLSEAVYMTDDVRPACLPLDYLFDESLSDRVLSLGWGEYEGTASDSKRIVELKVIGQEECGKRLQEWSRFNASMIFSVMCTIGRQAGEDVCEGDSGAPILQLRDGRFFVVGLVSFGPRCGMETFPGVSMRVSEYKNWILTNLKRIDGG